MDKSADFLNNLGNSSSCIRRRQLLSFLKGELQPEELRTVEMHLIDCHFCTKAFEALNQLENVESLIENSPFPEFKEIEFKKESFSKSPILEYKAPKIRKKPLKFVWTTSLSFLTILILLTIGMLYLYNKPNTNVLFSSKYNAIDSKNKKLQDFIDKEKINPESVVNSSFNSEKEKIALTSKDAFEDKNNNIIEEIKNEENNDEKIDSSKIKNNTLVKENQKEDNNEKNSTIIDDSTNIEKDKENKNEIKDKEKLKNEEESIVKEENKKKSEKTISDDPDYNNGFSSFQSENYGTAILYFKKIMNNKSHPNYIDALYYAAKSYEKLNKPKEASDLMEKLKDHPDGDKYL